MLRKNLREFNEQRLPKARGTVCHAPSVNLNFDQSGNVTACCYNRTFLLGTYPKDSILRIWEGAPARELRESLQKNDLSKGCDICRDQLVAGNYAGSLARNFDLYVSDEPGRVLWPQVMEFELSNVCNLECMMCTGHFSSLIRKNREKLPALHSPYDEEFVEQLKPFLPGLQTARFLGGEPFLNPLYFRIWEELGRVNPRIQPSITTNGTVFNAKVERVLKLLRPHLVVSIDSFDPANYERIRHRASFDKVRGILDRFLKYAADYDRTVTIAACPMPQNWRDLPGIVEFCNESTARLHFNTVVWPPECSFKNLASSDLKPIIAFLKEETHKHDWSKRSHVEKLPVRSQENIRCYQDVVNQLEGWL